MKQNSYERLGILTTTSSPNGFKQNVLSYHEESILLKIKDRKVLPSGRVESRRGDFRHGD
jgi:hypothetical protein